MGIVGIGVDMTTVSRIEKALRQEGFTRRVFGEEEKALFASRKKCLETQAANFAAKEAFGKALGSGILHEFSLHEAQALRDERGAPYFHFTGRAAELMKARRWKAHLSLSHEGGLATAFVVLESEEL